jgi:hypothetical protein
MHFINVLRWYVNVHDTNHCGQRPSQLDGEPTAFNTVAEFIHDNKRQRFQRHVYATGYTIAVNG